MAGPPDPAVLALTAEPFASVGDAHRRLAALERTFRARGDRRGAFLAIYARVTGEVGRSIAAGEFADPDWVADYLVAFAELYREALVAFETGDGELSGAWRLAFEAAATGDCLVSQAALLGINAHVNYDLALALDAAGLDADREARYADHCAVNDVLKRLVDEVQERLADRYAPGIATVDESLGRLDEAVAYWVLSVGRESAWWCAVALADSRSRWGLRRRVATAFRTGSSTGVAHLLLGPTRSTGLRALFGRIERGPRRRGRRRGEPDVETDGDGRDGTG